MHWIDKVLRTVDANRVVHGLDVQRLRFLFLGFGTCAAAGHEANRSPALPPATRVIHHARRGRKLQIAVEFQLRNPTH